MKFQLIKPINEDYSAIEQILTNRNIPHEDLFSYLNTTDKVINSYELLNKDALLAAARKIAMCVSNNQKAMVIVDSDCDGFTSSAVLINYLHDLFPSWVENNLTWFLHGGKQHGLSDFPFDTANQYKLFLIPDASSNDYDYHTLLKEQDIDIVVLDHHEAERISENAIIINNQLSDYPNKHMSGVGIVWQFCKFMDDTMGVSYADQYLDLVALGMDADMMSLKSLETKHLIEKGFKQVQNPFFEAMAEKNAYSMNSKITPVGVAFYIAPYVNAITRSGTLEEKNIVFQSMLKFKAFEKILSNKRGHKPGEMEQLYVQAIRTVTNVKNRQTRAQDAGIELLENMIEEQNLLRNKVLLFLLEPGQIDRNIAGLVANKFMAKYQRPCCILTRVSEMTGGNMIPLDDGDIEIKFEPTEFKVSYQGSARGCDLAGVTEFKRICEETECILFAEGHQGAFGLGIAADQIETFIERTNAALADMTSEAVYYIDYLYTGTQVNPEHILDIGGFDYLWGKDVEEPLVAIKNLKITADMLTLMSPDRRPTLKITLPNKVNLIKFFSGQEEYDSLFSEHGYVEIDVVGTCNKNEFQLGGDVYITPQILIKDYEIVDKMKYVF